MKKLSKDELEDVEYSIWGEGPTFTSSQGGGHTFYDATSEDIELGIKKGKIGNDIIKKEGNNLILITEFDPYDYVDKNLFDLYWSSKNKNNKITIKDEINSTLTNKDGKWYIIDVASYDKVIKGELGQAFGVE